MCHCHGKVHYASLIVIAMTSSLNIPHCHSLQYGVGSWPFVVFCFKYRQFTFKCVYSKCHCNETFCYDLKLPKLRLQTLKEGLTSVCYKHLSHDILIN